MSLMPPSFKRRKSSDPRPVIVLLHGAWHQPTCWKTIVPFLHAGGYMVVCPWLPSSGCDPVVPDFSEDVQVIRETVSDLLNDGRNVMVVMHSYSGLPGGEALKGFDQKSREASGEVNYVVRLIYINAYLVVEGTQLSPTGTRENMIPAMVADLKKGIVTADPALTRRMLYQDVTDEQLNDLNKSLVPQSIGVFWSKTSFAAWRYIPTTYVRCMKDMPSTVAITKYLIATAMASGHCKVDKVIETNAGHCPYITQPEWTADMLRTEAGEL